MSVSAQHLAAAFETFNETTQRLKEAYDKLQEKVAQLDRELEEKNKQLLLKVEELNRTRDYLHDILEAMTDGVLAVDVEGRITTFNRAAQRITGYTAAEAKDRRYSELFADSFGDLPRQVGRSEALRGHVPSELQRRDGTSVPVSESVALLTDRQGNVAGAIKVFQDLSEITRLKEQVRRNDRLAAVGQMAAAVAHEIRNPLGGIEGFAALLARDIPRDDPKSVLVERILAGTKSLNRVVSELLAFTRPMKFEFETIDCEELLKSVLALAGDGNNGVAVSVETDGTGYPASGGATLVGDAEKLKQVFLNIVLNAFQSMADGGELRIKMRREDRSGEREAPSVIVTFADTGCGIPKKVLPRIFEPFFTTKEKGTGLGLSVAARIVEGHGGRITATSTEGVGSTFEIRLPCDAQQVNEWAGGTDGG
jgi:PAS domain S-box-containing protein